ncbi:MAG: cation diffusion facilitator family transporter [Candidatus Saccharibacteria bacterium]|nr:cation diffusion facilitator family transporter [Candidatus Saccharibacteria bacterium]
MAKPKNVSAEHAVGVSILVSVGDILLNIIVAVFTQSAVMLAQALQGAADLTTALLLLIGVKKSDRKADATHPFGFGREVFFWTLLASIFALVVTGGFAITQGVRQILDPQNVMFPLIALGMLSFGFVTNAYSMHVSLRRLGYTLQNADTKATLRRIFHSSLVETKTTLLIDLMGTLSALVGFVSLFIFWLTGEVFFDGIGAVIVGGLIVAGAVLLIYNLRGFIVGISPRPEVINEIKRTTLSVKHVQDVLDLRAITVGSGKIFVVVEVHFADDLNTDEVETTTDRIKQKLKKRLPMITRVQIEAETPEK